jgi:hypothetical protein
VTDEARTVVAALHRLSDDVAEPPTVLTDAYRRAGQLRRRQRGVLAAVLVLALTAAGAGAQWFASTRPGPDRTAAVTAADLLTQPTRGDLAGDAGLRARIITVWRDNRNMFVGPAGGNSLYTRAGAPSVLLAQQTPAGPAAIVVERATLTTPEPTLSGKRMDTSDSPRQVVAIGYVATGTDGALTVLDAEPANLTEPLHGLAFLVGADRSSLVVMSEGDPLGFSSGRVYPAAGPPTRTFSPIPLNDGVAVVAVPPGADRTALAVAVSPATSYKDGVDILNPPPPATRGKVVQVPARDSRLQWDGQLWVLPDDQAAEAAWGVPNLRQTTHGMTDAADKVVEAWRRAFDAERVDPFADSSSETLWYAYGALPDGRAFVVGDGQLGNDPSYLYGAIVDHGTQSTIYGGRVDPTAPLPVKLRFPDGQGWLVAAKGATLAYLTDTWHDAGSNAALLPAGATRVRVTPAGGQPTVVPLG